MSSAALPPPLIPAVGSQDHMLGTAKARVELVEYGDFQSPHCRDAFPILQDVRKALGSRLRFVYRHFPMSTLHPLAKWAAVASEAAGEAGKFWEMHDLLFTRQEHLEVLTPQDLARAVGLEPEAFLQRMQAGELYRKVEQDFYHGVKSGVNGAPTLFLNGRRYVGAWNPASLLEALRAELRPRRRRPQPVKARRRPASRPARRPRRKPGRKRK